MRMAIAQLSDPDKSFGANWIHSFFPSHEIHLQSRWKRDSNNSTEFVADKSFSIGINWNEKFHALDHVFDWVVWRISGVGSREFILIFSEFLFFWFELCIRKWEESWVMCMCVAVCVLKNFEESDDETL